MDLLQRLKEIITYSGMSVRAFAIRCNINQTTLDKQIKGLRSVSIETIVGVLYGFPEISAEWLMRGTGQMLLSQSGPDNDRVNTLIDTIATLQESINVKNDTIESLSTRIKQLETQQKK